MYNNCHTLISQLSLFIFSHLLLNIFFQFCIITSHIQALVYLLMCTCIIRAQNTTCISTVTSVKFGLCVQSSPRQALLHITWYWKYVGQGCQLSRTDRDTHAINTFHTLTQHVHFLMQRKTNLYGWGVKRGHLEHSQASRLDFDVRLFML